MVMAAVEGFFKAIAPAKLQKTYGRRTPSIPRNFQYRFAPALARETVYMPSQLAALVLGRGPVTGVVIRSSSEVSGSRPDASAA